MLMVLSQKKKKRLRTCNVEHHATVRDYFSNNSVEKYKVAGRAGEVAWWLRVFAAVFQRT